MRLFTAICVLALAVAFTAPAFAETQNIKVSGDVKVAHVYQKDIDFDQDELGVENENDNQTFFLQQVGLNIEADLTDNVSTYVRLISERDWNAEDGGNTAFDIDLDEAYVTLKEMLYAPLTLKIGRQNIWLGQGFVIGNAGLGVWDNNGSIPNTIDELSDATAFDAIRATLDYDPWTIDLIYSKIEENNPLITDDDDLVVVNVGYDFEKYDAEAEAYYILLHDKSGRLANGGVGTITDSNEIQTVGLRGSFVPFDQMNIYAEGAMQFGDYSSATNASVDREAFAFNIGGDYTFADVKWTPVLKIGYEYLSGEQATAGGDWNAWHPLFRGKFDNQIGIFRNITKLNDFDGAAIDTTQNNNGTTNQNTFMVGATIEPMTDITLGSSFSYFWYDEVAVAGRSDDIGYEIDGLVTYDYTEDVQFTVAGSMFVPQDYYPDGQDDTAAQVISAVTVDF